jgi:hypothetical protein
MMTFLYGWERDIAYLLGIGNRNEALLRDCTVTSQDPVDRDIASMNLLDKVWLRLQLTE